MIQEIVKAVSEMTPVDGYTDTYLPEVSVFRAENDYPNLPIVYDQCICMVVQGSKDVSLSDKTLTYDPSHFLVVPTIVPLECDTVATKDDPFFGITISIDYVVLQEIIDQIGSEFSEASVSLAPQPGAYLELLTDEIMEPTLRLLHSLKVKGEAEVLGLQTIREIYYRALMGKNGHILASAARGESAYANIASILRSMHDDYAASLDVAELAARVNMSVRSFHEHFKAVTSYSPLQYVKRVRLDKARMLLVNQGLQANVTAHMVGYESSSQFSREFKRYFGYSPKEAQNNFASNMTR
ncbi:MAG: AraC family transcriptional regulator [Pseudodesulfovibrio sp.]